MPATIVSTSQNGGTAANDTTIQTPNIDTSGMGLFAVFLAWYTVVGDPAVSDFYTNTWVAGTKYVYAPYHAGRWYYCLTPIVGPNHWFKLTGVAADYPCIYAYGATGAWLLDTESNGNSSNNIVQPGSVTPAVQPGSLILLAGQIDAGGTTAVDSGYTRVADYPYSGGFSFGGSSSYLLHTSGPVNPTMTTTGGTTTFVNMATTIVFSPVVAAGPKPSFRQQSFRPRMFAPGNGR